MPEFWRKILPTSSGLSDETGKRRNFIGLEERRLR
jgi:hypothetical protein